MLQLLICVCTAAAAATDSDVRRVVTLYDDMSYAEVIQHAERALTRDDLGAEDRALALGLLARAHAALRHPEEAVDTFVRLLEVRPKTAVHPYESPLIQEAFRAARERVAEANEPEEKPAAEPLPAPSPEPPVDEPPPTVEPPTPAEPPPAEVPTEALTPTTPPAEPEQLTVNWKWLGIGAGIAALAASVILASVAAAN